MYTVGLESGTRAYFTGVTILISLPTLDVAEEFAILGHSGESASIPFVNFGQPPANRGDLTVSGSASFAVRCPPGTLLCQKAPDTFLEGGERLKILQQMLAHSQFCWPGDNTIEVTSKIPRAYPLTHDNLKTLSPS